VRELEPQDDQVRDDPVGERQLTVRARALSAQPVMTPALAQPGLLPRQPWISQPSDQLAQPARRQASTDTMRQGRAGPSRRHIVIVPRGRSRSPERHAKISCYARELLSRTKSQAATVYWGELAGVADPAERIRVTLVPGGTSDPAAGSWKMTRPYGSNPTSWATLTV
jgi:hypothetical protein